jgi:hypothetical protein
MTFHELFELQKVKNNYGQLYKPTVQLSIYILLILLFFVLNLMA